MSKLIGKARTQGISVLLASMPLCFALSTKVKAIPIGLLFLVGLYTLICKREVRYYLGKIWPVLAVCLLYVAYATLNIFIHGLGWSPFDLPAHILLCIGISVPFAQTLDKRLLWMGFSASACVLGGIAMFQHYGQGIARVYGVNGGPWGAIEFAMYLLVLSLLGLIQLLRQSNRRHEQCLHGLAIGMGTCGAVLTQSRGPLLGFIPVLILCMILYIRRNQQYRCSLLFLMPVVLATPLLIQGHLVQRLHQVHTEVSTYTPDHVTQGAVRARLEMWRTAWHGFMEHPFAGVGLDQFGVYARQQVRIGRSGIGIYKYNHPHNEYLDAAVTGGVMGILAIFLVFFVPLTYFINHTQHPSAEVADLGLAGTAITSLYAICGITDNVLYRTMPLSLYYFLILGLAIMIARQRVLVCNRHSSSKALL